MKVIAAILCVGVLWGALDHEPISEDSSCADWTAHPSAKQKYADEHGHDLYWIVGRDTFCAANPHAPSFLGD